jgi:4-guanidinobutyraldehyde dehydrogenase/NAD-dependent aldehyde dehydrogenase
VLAATDELALLETLDMGKPIKYSRSVDVPAAANCIRWYGEAVDKVYDQIAPTADDSLALITREPVGVVAAIVPWNYPLIMAAWKIAPALAAGNSVVLKPSEKSPLSALRLAEIGDRGRLAGGRVQRGARLRRRSRRRAGAAHGRGLHRFYRLDPGRQADPADGGAVEPEAGLD